MPRKSKYVQIMFYHVLLAITCISDVPKILIGDQIWPGQGKVLQRLLPQFGQRPLAPFRAQGRRPRRRVAQADAAVPAPYTWPRRRRDARNPQFLGMVNYVQSTMYSMVKPSRTRVAPLFNRFLLFVLGMVWDSTETC